MNQRLGQIFKYEKNKNEGSYFINNRENECIDFSWEGIIICLNHGLNITNRTLNKENKDDSNKLSLPIEFFRLLHNKRDYLLKNN